MEETRQATCNERIAERMKSRLNQYMPDLEDLETCKCILQEYCIEVPEDEEELKQLASDTFQENVCNDVLSVDKVTTYKVLLSYGGPSDQFEFDFNSSGELVEGRYRFMDWFDGAVRDLSFEEAEELVQVFGIYHEIL